MSHATGVGALADDGNALFTKVGAVIDGATAPASLQFADGSRAPFAITLLSELGASVRIQVDH